MYSFPFSFFPSLLFSRFASLSVRSGLGSADLLHLETGRSLGDAGAVLEAICAVQDVRGAQRWGREASFILFWFCGGGGGVVGFLKEKRCFVVCFEGFGGLSWVGVQLLVGLG